MEGRRAPSPGALLSIGRASAAATERPFRAGAGQRPSLCPPPPGVSVSCPPGDGRNAGRARARVTDVAAAAAAALGEPAAGDTWWPFPGSPCPGVGARPAALPGLPEAPPRARANPRGLGSPRPRSWKIRRESQSFSENGMIYRGPAPRRLRAATFICPLPPGRVSPPADPGALLRASLRPNSCGLAGRPGP